MSLKKGQISDPLGCMSMSLSNSNWPTTACVKQSVSPRSHFSLSANIISPLAYLLKVVRDLKWCLNLFTNISLK